MQDVRDGKYGRVLPFLLGEAAAFGGGACGSTREAASGRTGGFVKYFGRITSAVRVQSHLELHGGQQSAAATRRTQYVAVRPEDYGVPKKNATSAGRPIITPHGEIDDVFSSENDNALLLGVLYISIIF